MARDSHATKAVEDGDRCGVTTVNGGILWCVVRVQEAKKQLERSIRIVGSAERDSVLDDDGVSKVAEGLSRPARGRIDIQGAGKRE